MPIFTGKTAEYRREISNEFAKKAKVIGCNLVEFVEVMPASLIDSKFLNEDWIINQPVTGDKFVLSPEYTAYYAAIVAQNPNDERLARVAYISTCFRENRFVQLGVEYRGNSIKDDAKITKFAYEFCKNLGLEPILKVNDLAALRTYVAQIGVPQEKSEFALKWLDNKSGDVGQLEINNFSKASQSGLKDLVDGKQIPVNAEFMEYLSAIEYTGAILDQELSRGLTYYNASAPRVSAPVFEIRLGGKQACGGGRYDGLLGKIQPTLKNSEADSAFGFAFGLERLIEAKIAQEAK